MKENYILYLDEISERLWTGHATVMVGAGFSKNAHKAIAGAPDFPNWHELGNYLYKKIHNSFPDAKTHYLNPLKLADEVQAAFGRPALDQLIRTVIPDKEYEPSDLHIQLLELPWTDVFTVNYDTLLERASEKVVSRKFDIIVNKEDLVYSTRPRIVKLHGSFPSTRPFILSEEDYRCYPREYAPLVNMVQQSLLENTLCLIGFSGDDPNFLHWIGWVRDNLGRNNSPKIYLVGIHSLTDAQKKLLQERCVVLVDLENLEGVESDHKKALAYFFQYLRKKRPPDPFQWPYKKVNPDSVKEISVEVLTEEWKKTRESYPNWIVAPESTRNNLRVRMSFLWNKIESNFLSKMQQIQPLQDINFLYELNWQLERMLFQIPGNWVPYYERILQRYNPCPNKLGILSKEQIDPEQRRYSNIDWKILEYQWVGLNISLLRFWREEGMSEKWNVINARLECLIDRISAEQLAWLFYERCLKALFDFDFVRVKDFLMRWPVNWTVPFGEAKRAGILAELGEITKALEILENALAHIRSNQQLTPVGSNFSWVSQEIHVMHLYHVLDFSRRLIPISAGDDLPQKFWERCNELKQYECDPWQDLKLFDLNLKILQTPMDLVTRNQTFDIDRETVTYHLGRQDNAGIVQGVSFLRYCEEVGLPFVLSSVNIAKEQAGHAAERIAQYSFVWAVVTLLRIGESKSVESLFGRVDLLSMNVERSDELVKWFLGILRRTSIDTSKDNFFIDRNLATRIWQVIPEILSRLCSKCSSQCADETFKLLKELYGAADQIRGSHDGIANLTMRLISSYSHPQQYQKLPELLKFPLIKQDPFRNFPEPFEFLSISRQSIKQFETLANVKVEIDILLGKMMSGNSEERFRAGFRLGRLYDWNLLSKKQSIALGNAFWAKIDPNGFPTDSSLFYKCFFLSLPAPKQINVTKLFKQYVNNASLININSGGPTVSVSGKDPVAITHGDIRLCAEILSATKYKNGEGWIDWSIEETVELLNRLIEWWDSGKEHLKEKDAVTIFGESIPKEFRLRYRNLVLILAKVISPRLNKKTEKVILKKLKHLLDELKSYGLNVLIADAACVHLFPDTKEYILTRIQEELVDKIHLHVIDALDAVIVLFNKKSMRNSKKLNRLLFDLTQQIKWRRDHELPNILDAMKEIVRDASNSFDVVLIENMLSGLLILSRQTEMRDGSFINDPVIRLSFRKHAAALAYVLCQYYKKRNIDLSSQILEWQRICADPQEFVEIRNQWEF